ncbi:MAG: hypothetical protein A2Y07_06040 [Planctomycetes bacterium GWF2_50_10]|nr:MAG: hypothetical protein A2Y07_06040 [Planctomycetes bacterium GWF2_50_10]
MEAGEAMKIKIITRGAVIRIAILLTFLTAVLVWCYFAMLKSPGSSWSGPREPLGAEELLIRDSLQSHVEHFAGTIGERNVLNYPKLTQCAGDIEKYFILIGLDVRKVSFKSDNLSFDNIEASKKGATEPGSIIVIGAHYDSCGSTPGANDNATGVACMLALAKAASKKTYDKTIRFVAFVNEEPPFFKGSQMGSLVYARFCKENKDNITAMLSLETMGYYTDEKNSQRYPFPFDKVYPSTGNFIGFVGNYESRQLVREVTTSFRRNCKFPSESGAVPSSIAGAGWSDHWSFWQIGVPALMVTDTAFFRYPYYHRKEDTPDKINYDCLARVTAGLDKVLDELAGFTANQTPKTELANSVAKVR